jgi:hypothetical protein
MGVGQTGRIINYDVRVVVDALVERYNRKQKARQQNNFKKFLLATATCSQCKRKMRKDIADEQIKNNRENAPICVPCIMGIKRRPMSELKKDRKHYSKESQKALVKVIKKYKHHNEKETTKN